MVRYVDLDKIVAEIERWIELFTNEKNQEGISQIDKLSLGGRIAELQEVKTFINTLEVKKVDLDEEADNYWETLTSDVRDSIYFNDFYKIAKHFFELGLRSTITEEDCKLIWNIGDDLPYMSEEEFFKELLRRYKAQKGGIA